MGIHHGLQGLAPGGLGKGQVTLFFPSNVLGARRAARRGQGEVQSSIMGRHRGRASEASLWRALRVLRYRLLLRRTSQAFKLELVFVRELAKGAKTFSSAHP